MLRFVQRSADCFTAPRLSELYLGEMPVRRSSLVMAPPEGIEPPYVGLEFRCLIHSAKAGYCHQGRRLLLYEQHGADDFATRSRLS